MLRAADLARWTPVAFHPGVPESCIDWCDMTGERFADPFFHETVARLTKGTGERPVVRTPLAALTELDGAPSLDPCGLVFHMGRCGSTLVGRLLSLVPGVVAVREPTPINNLLEAGPASMDESERVRILRLLVRALGRVRFGDERSYVLKLSSWNVCHASLFRRAFPGVPMVWVQRRPLEVLASMIEGPPGWLALRDRPAQVAHQFGLDPARLPGRMDGFEFAGRLVAAMLDAALATDACIVDYDELPDAVPDIVAPHFGIACSAGDRAAMEELARYHAKRADAVPFTDDTERKHTVPDRAVAVASSLLEERYSRLNERRRAQRRSGDC